MQFGPIKEPFTLLIMATIFFSISAPSLLSSLNPAERIINAFVFFCLARILTVSSQYLAAIAIIAKSTEGSSFTSAIAFIPWTIGSFGFTT